MKKILSVVAAFALAAALISCGGNSDEFDGKVDTVLTIGAPKVTAKAYPGVNYITWEPVASANDYELYRIGDGDANGVKLTLSKAKTAYADIAAASPNNDLSIADGKTYKYVVIAVPENAANKGVNTPAQIPTRAIYMKANQGSASVTAKVPAAGSSIGDEKAFSFYKDFLKKFDEKNLAKNVTITKVQDVKANSGNWGGFYVSYPATAGLKFKVAQVEETGVGADAAYIGLDTFSASTETSYKENYIANAALTTLGSGDKDIYVKIESVANTLYQPIVKKVGTIEVKGIKETKTTGETTPVTAAYRTVKTDSAAATAEIYWSPAILADTGKAADPANYIVYRKTTSDNEDDYTVVAGVEGKPAITAKKVAKKGSAGNTISIGSSTTGSVNGDGTTTGTVTATADGTTLDTVYTFTDTITDVSATYKYYVVLKIGDLYGTASTAGTLKPYKYKTNKPTIAINKSVQQTASKKTELQILVKRGDTGIVDGTETATGKYNTTQKLSLKYAKLAKDFNDTTVTTFTDFTEDATAKLVNYAGDNYTYVAYITVDYNTSYVFQVEATETGKDPNYAYAQHTEGDEDIYGAPTVIVAEDDDAAADNLKYIVVTTDNGVQAKANDGLATFEDYIYTLYQVTTSSNRYFDDYVTVTEAKVGEFTLSALTEANRDKYKTNYVALASYSTSEDQKNDTTGTVHAKYINFQTVTAPKQVSGDDSNKWTHRDSVRFYVVKTKKGTTNTTGPKAAEFDTTGIQSKFTSINVK